VLSPSNILPPLFRCSVFSSSRIIWVHI
jgi:hypothetical protein